MWPYDYQDICARALAGEVLDALGEDDLLPSVAQVFFTKGAVIVSRDVLHRGNFVYLSPEEVQVTPQGDLLVVPDTARLVTGDLIPGANYIYLCADQSKVKGLPVLFYNGQWEDEEQVLLWMDEWDRALDRLQRWILATTPLE